jgi:putative proteasome-type protease
MTFCLGMKCQEGLMAIADTRITSGNEMSLGKKISIHQYSRHSMFILTSGLRSLRDKAITYFEERLQTGEEGLERMYQAANALSTEIRRVRSEDKEWLADSGLSFDLHCIFGGQLHSDAEPHLYLIYPEGNWIEVRPGTPYVIIGETRYGKPILDRLWRYTHGLDDALRVGLLAFDATKTSASDVDYPVDVVSYQSDSWTLREQRFTGEDLGTLRRQWQRAIHMASEGLRPAVSELYDRLQAAPPAVTHFEEDPDDVPQAEASNGGAAGRTRQAR